MTKLTFESLSKCDPNIIMLPQSENGGSIATSFWEDLYALFRDRMESEQSARGGKMNVKELIEFLQAYPQDMQIAYTCMSSQALLERKDIRLIEACVPRPDGWIHDRRPDMVAQPYLLFPGN